MAGVTWHYALKFIITGLCSSTAIVIALTPPPNAGDAAVGKSSLLVRLTDQRFMTNPDPTVRAYASAIALPFLTRVYYGQLGVEFGSKLIEIPEQSKIIKLQCQSPATVPA